MTAEPVDAGKRVYRRPGVDPSQCKRRWFSLDPDCVCSNCLPDARRMAKLRRHGRKLPPARSDEAWAAVERMLQNGWTIGAIAHAAGIDAAGLSVDHHRQVKAGMNLGRVRAERIIAAEKKTPTAGRVSALTARRQLQALAAIGWSLRDLQPLTGIAWQTLNSIRGEIVQLTDASRVAEIDRVYSQLSMTVGTNERVRREATKRRWAPPLAWDNISDPAAKPDGLLKERKRA